MFLVIGLVLLAVVSVSVSAQAAVIVEFLDDNVNMSDVFNEISKRGSVTSFGTTGENIPVQYDNYSVTLCENKSCKKQLFGSQQYAQNIFGSWVPINELSSWKNTTYTCNVRKDSKDDPDVTCIDFNATSITIRLDNATQLDDLRKDPDSFRVQEKGNASRVKDRPDFSRSNQVSITWDPFSDELHIGKNSTTVVINPGGNGLILEDSFAREADPTDSYGIAKLLRVGDKSSSDSRTALLLNLDLINENYTVTSARLFLYLNQTSSTYGINASSYYMYQNYTWNPGVWDEGNGDIPSGSSCTINDDYCWNNKPDGPAQINTTPSDTIPLVPSSVGSYYSWDISPNFINDHNTQNTSISFEIRAVADILFAGEDSYSFNSKEAGANIPYIEVTFEENIIATQTLSTATFGSEHNHGCYVGDMYWQFWLNQTASSPEVGYSNSSNGVNWHSPRQIDTDAGANHPISSQIFSVGCTGSLETSDAHIYMTTGAGFGATNLRVMVFNVTEDYDLVEIHSDDKNVQSSSSGVSMGIFADPSGRVRLTGRQDNTMGTNNLTDTNSNGNTFAFDFNTDTNGFNGVGGTASSAGVVSMHCDPADFTRTYSSSDNGLNMHTYIDGTFSANTRPDTMLTGNTNSYDASGFCINGEFNLSIAFLDSTNGLLLREALIGTTTSLRATPTTSTVKSGGGISLSRNLSSGDLWVFYLVNNSVTETYLAVQKWNGTWSGEFNITTTASVKNHLSCIPTTGPDQITCAWVEGTDPYQVFVTNYSIVEQEVVLEPEVGINPANISFTYPVDGQTLTYSSGSLNFSVNSTINTTQDISVYTKYLFINGTFNHTHSLNTTLNLSAGDYLLNISVWNGSVMSVNDTVSVTVELQADTCTYTSGTWNMLCSDNCIVDTPVDLGGNDWIITGEGTVEINADVTGVGSWLTRGDGPNNQCVVIQRAEVR